MSEVPPEVRIFISYRRDDARVRASEIYGELAEHFGEERVFQDVNDIEPMVPWEEAIDDALGSCDVFLVLIGSGWLTATTEEGKRRLDDPNDRHRREIEVAIDRTVRLCPVLIDGAKMPEPADLPESLKRLPKINGQPVRRTRLLADLEGLKSVIEKAAAAEVSKKAAAAEAKPAPAPVAEPEPVEVKEPSERHDTGQVEIASEAREKAEQGEFREARALADSIEDPMGRVGALVAIAEAQAASGRPSYEAKTTLSVARKVAFGLARSERGDALEAVGAAEQELRISGVREKVKEGELEAAREAAASIQDPERREALLAEVTEAVEKADAEREERARELVGRAREQAGAGNAEDARATLGSAKDTAEEIEDPDRQQEVIGAIEALAAEIRTSVRGTEQGEFSAAEEIVGASGTTRRSNTTATKEAGEPNHAGNPGGRSVWYRWTAPKHGAATIDTFESDFDTLLAVYRGSSLAGLEPVAWNDDAGGPQSRVVFPVAEGNEHRIAVDGYGGAAGEIVLNWTVEEAPANDAFDAPGEISGATGSTTGDSVAATKELGEPNHGGNPGGRSVWYRWTAPKRGAATIDTFGSDFDTLLAVYRGSSLAGLEPVAANDDAGGPQSRVVFLVREGDEYRIAVDGYGGAGGAVVLNWDVREAPPLVEVVRATGLPFVELPGGGLASSLAGEQTEVVVNAQELSEGVALFFVGLPEVRGLGMRAFLQAALKISFAADYVKAVHLSDSQYALAVELPTSALTPSVCEGMIRGLVALGDVKAPADLIGLSWNKRLQSCAMAQDALIRVDQDAARAEVSAMLPGAGAPAGLSLHVSQRVISLVLPMEGLKPGGNRDKLRGLLDLNRRADVAKVGLNAKGEVTLLYEVPQVVPDLIERAQPQLASLHVAVRELVG